MAKINIPHKVVTSEFQADELNLMVTAINENAVAADEPSHAFSDEHFVQEGTVDIGGKAYPVIKLKLNPAHFEIVNGLISIKASLLA